MNVRGPVAGLLLLAAATSVSAQERPPDPAADTLRPPAVRVDGTLLDELPADDARRVLRFFPGFTESEPSSVYHRARTSAFTTYIDGVPVRSMLGIVIEPPLNAIDALIITKASSAAGTAAASVEYSTLRGSGAWHLDAGVHSNALSPSAWDQKQTRFQLNAGGQIPGIPGLRVDLAGDLLGRQYNQLPTSDLRVFVASGIDTTFTLPSSGGGSVEVAVPDFIPARYDELPIGNNDRLGVVGALTYEGDAALYRLGYYRTGDRTMGRDLVHMYNPDFWRGQTSTSQAVSLTMKQSLPFGVVADVALSHQRADFAWGILDPEWASTNAQPSLGIVRGSFGFLTQPSDWPVTDAVLAAVRSGVIPVDAYALDMDANETTLRYGAPGVSQALRINPWAARTNFSVGGMGGGDPALAWGAERRWYGRAVVSRGFGAHDVQVGAELDRTTLERLTIPLVTGPPATSREEPHWSALFVQGSTVVQNIRAEAGVRLERHGAGAMLPRAPGFTAVRPDSLRGDAWELAAGPEPWQERLQPVEDCGGAATLPQRTNSSGAAVCLNNLIPTREYSSLNPRLAVGWEGSARFRPYASWGFYVQPQGWGHRTADALLTASPYQRDTEPVRENVAQLGVRVATTRASWVDVQLFRQDVENALVARRPTFFDPISGAPYFPLVLLNGESFATTGVEVSAQQRLGSRAGAIASVTLSTSDADGDGLDPAHAAAIAWIDLGAVTPALADLTVHATATYTGGDPYTRLRNDALGSLVGRLGTSLAGGVLAEEINASRLPSRTELDLRIAKGFDIAGARARIVADLRNPLGFDNVHTVYAETGTTTNEPYRNAIMTAQFLNYVGTGAVNDMIIDDQPENDLNRYMLRRAEQRFGNGDGVFSVEEMLSVVGSFNDLLGGSHYLRDRGRELRLGVEIAF